MAITKKQNQEQLIEETSPWDWKIPSGLLIFGLLILVIHGFVTAGTTGSSGVLKEIGFLLLVYLPLTIIAMFLVAPILDITFGEFGPAVLKITGLYVFTAALQDVGTTVGPRVLAWFVSLGASLFLYSKAFDLTAMETIGTVILVSVIRGLLGLGLASFLSRWI